MSALEGKDEEVDEEGVSDEEEGDDSETMEMEEGRGKKKEKKSSSVSDEEEEERKEKESESENEEEEEEKEVELPDLTDEEMFRYDFKLEETFRIARSQLRKRRNEKTLLLHYHLRVLDLIDIYMDSTRGVSEHTHLLVSPLISMLLRSKGERREREREREEEGRKGGERGGEVLTEKVKKVLGKVTKSKAKACVPNDLDEFRRGIQKEISSLLLLLSSSSLSSSLSALSLSAADFGTLSVSCLSRILKSAFAARGSVGEIESGGRECEREGFGVFSQQDLLDCLSPSLSLFLTKKNSRFNAGFFLQIFQRFPKQFSVFVPLLLSSSSLSPSPFLLRTLFDILSVFLLHHKTMGSEWVRENFASFSKAIENALTHNVLADGEMEKGEEEEEEGEKGRGKEGPKYNSKRTLNLLSFCENLSACAAACGLTKREEEAVASLKDLLSKIYEKYAISPLVQVGVSVCLLMSV